MTGRRPGRRTQPLGTTGGTVSRLGAMVRAWRDYRGVSLTELATRAGFGPSGRGYLSKVEHGQLTPGQDKLTSIATALEVSVDDLLLQRLPPGATPLPSGTGDVLTSSSTNVSAPRRRGLRLGSGFVAAPRGREDLLRDILRRTADIEALVAELLRSEQRGEGNETTGILFPESNDSA
jgi:transcriptional regulator with XRE-family HTH domain